MEAKSLRIGNLLFNDSVVVEIDARSIFDIWDDKGLKNYKPIPLTKEWLLKFGFIAPFGETANVKRYIRGSELHLNFTINDSKIYLAFLNSEDIEHVHSLQNLYFALTGKELTYE